MNNPDVSGLKELLDQRVVELAAVNAELDEVRAQVDGFVLEQQALLEAYDLAPDVSNDEKVLVTAGIEGAKAKLMPRFAKLKEATAALEAARLDYDWALHVHGAPKDPLADAVAPAAAEEVVDSPGHVEWADHPDLPDLPVLPEQS